MRAVRAIILLWIYAATTSSLAEDSRAQQRADIQIGPIHRVGSDRSHLPHVEPVVAVHPDNPEHLVAASIVVEDPLSDTWTDTWRVHTQVSLDGGATWTRGDLPDFGDVLAADPWLAWARDGSLLLSCLAERPDEQGRKHMEVVIFRSDDGGQSWSRPSSAFPRGQSYDHPVLSVGDDGSIVVFATGEPFGSLSLTSSNSASLSFSPWPGYRPDSLNNNLGSGVVLSDGTPVFSYYSMSVPQPSALWAIHSRTNGLSYERALITREHIPVGFPMMAVDRSDGPKRDRVYSVWVRSDAEPYVMISHSDDFGASWSDPVRVHTDSSASSRTLPYVAVNDVGVVAAAWIDGRHHEGSCWDIYATASLDGGATFLPERRVTPETSCPNATGNGGAGRRWRWGGDYIGMTSDANGAFHVIWSDSRTGVYQNWIARLTIAGQREE